MVVNLTAVRSWARLHFRTYSQVMANAEYSRAMCHLAHDLFLYAVLLAERVSCPGVLFMTGFIPDRRRSKWIANT
jgi:hypothetical protein